MPEHFDYTDCFDGDKCPDECNAKTKKECQRNQQQYAQSITPKKTEGEQ
jgi:hypothetical protein